MRKFLTIVVTVFSLFQGYSQPEQTVISEANRLNVSSKQDAKTALSSKGISESQARQMAKLRGIDYDTALAEYLKSKEGDVKKTTLKKGDTEVVTELKVADLAVETVLPTKLNTTHEKASQYFGYNIFKNNPFGQKEYLLGNIDEGYILAPGDELRITVFGDNNLEFVSKIDLNGNISFPNLGMFFAAGNSFATSETLPANKQYGISRTVMSIPILARYGALRRPAIGLQVLIVTDFNSPTAAALSASIPNIAPDGTIICPPFLAANSTKSSRPRSWLADITTKILPAFNTACAIS